MNFMQIWKSQETLEAKTDLNFECYDEATDETVSLNGLTRSETDKAVKKHFGTMEDHKLTTDMIGIEMQLVKQNHTKEYYPFTGISWTTDLGMCVMSQP